MADTVFSQATCTEERTLSPPPPGRLDGLSADQALGIHNHTLPPSHSSRCKDPRRAEQRGLGTKWTTGNSVNTAWHVVGA